MSTWLTPGGTAAAIVIGAVVVIGGGWEAAAMLALFFVSGSILTYAVAPAKGAPRTSRGRSGAQVVANGFWAALGAVLIANTRDAGWAMLTGSLATAQADTWATELGIRTGRQPRLITSGRAVRIGTSGGITVPGSMAGVLGALLMSGLVLTVGLPLELAAAAFLGGIIGMLADSLLGATVQGVYYCEACAVETELRSHHCGHQARLARGAQWFGNNAVNFFATGIGALVTLALRAI